MASHTPFSCFQSQPSELVMVLRGIYHVNSEAYNLLSPNMHLNGFLSLGKKKKKKISIVNRFSSLLCKLLRRMENSVISTVYDDLLLLF